MVLVGSSTLLAPSTCPSCVCAPLPRQRSRGTTASVVVCECECEEGGPGGRRRRSSSMIPKLEPFSRSRIERGMKDPPFLQKRLNDLTEYCTTLEGDKSHSCWRAYFELKDLQKEIPTENVEKIVRQSGGLKSLICIVHAITAANQNDKKKKEKNGVEEEEKTLGAAEGEKPFLVVPDGLPLPKTQEEVEEEESARMPDSSFTRLLRRMGKLPDWYSQPPDHETD